VILYQGLLSSPASWARVGRGYLGGLLAAGIDVAAVITRGFRYDPDFPLPSGLPIMAVSDTDQLPTPDIGLGFLHPPHLNRLLGKYKANLFVWESNVVPSEWVDRLARGTDLVIVPSSFSRQALIASGLSSDKIAVAAYGYAEHWEHESSLACQERRAPFTFLTVAAPHWRKGIRELCQAYMAAFSASDNVRLRIKSTYDPADSKRRFAFEIPSWDQLLQDCGLKQPSSPRIELIVETSTDAELESLYREADVYVGASWGESFGLAILDAMAMGIPAIVNGWGGQMDFVSNSGDIVDYDLQTRDEGLYEPVEGALVAVPKIDSLAQRLRWHFDHPESSREMGQRGGRAVRSMSWDSATRQLLDCLPLG